MSLYVVFFAVGAYDMWNTNGAKQIMNIYIPGVYVSSTVGIVLLAIFNTLAMVNAGMCVSPQDMLFFLVFGNVPLLSAIVRIQMEELTQMLRFKRSHAGSDAIFIMRYLMHYIGIHHQYNE